MRQSTLSQGLRPEGKPEVGYTLCLLEGGKVLVDLKVEGLCSLETHPGDIIKRDCLITFPLISCFIGILKKDLTYSHEVRVQGVGVEEPC